MIFKGVNNRELFSLSLFLLDFVKRNTFNWPFMFLFLVTSWAIKHNSDSEKRVKTIHKYISLLVLK